MLSYTLQIENENEKIIQKIKNFAEEIGAKLKINKPQLTENGFTEEFEKEYTYEGTDLGVTLSDNKTTFKVWAPTAENVSVNFYAGGDARMKDLIESVSMEKEEKGEKLSHPFAL